MWSSEKQQNNPDSDQSLKLAIAMALLRSKLLQKPDHPPSSSSATSESDAMKWKRKAKERKQQLLKLKEDLKEAEDGLQFDLFPQGASCKCYFFDKLGNLSPKRFSDDSDKRINDVLRRRFLRQVRLKDRRRNRANASSYHRKYIPDRSVEDELEQLRASVDFLVELCDTISPIRREEANFTNWSHQAVDFILVALKNLSSMAKNMEPLEGIVNGLITRLVRRMCSSLQGDELHHFHSDGQFYVQHLIRKLGSEPFIGQRVIFSVSQRISVLAESLLFMDPFDGAFPNTHSCMYIMIQLIEFLVSDYLLTWSSSEGFDTRLFEEWVLSVLHGRQAVELLESRNGLYVLYMDRVIGEVAKQMGQVSSLRRFNPDILDKLFP